MIFCAYLVVTVGCGNNPTSSTRSEPPSPPRDLAASKYSDGEVILHFTLSDGQDVVGYHVYRAMGGGEFAKVGFVEEGRFRDIDLTYDQPCYYRVVAVNRVGLESTPLEIGGTPYNNLFPAIPQGIQIEARNLTMLGYDPEIELTWVPNREADLAHYNVYSSTESEFAMTEHNRIDAIDTPRFVHTEVVEGSTYFYKITAVDRGGLESLAAEVRVELMHPPILEQPTDGSDVVAKPVFAWQTVPVSWPDTQVRYTVSLSTGPAARELWVADVEGNKNQVKYTGPELDPGVYWWCVLVEVEDSQGTAVSLALSSLENFKVR